MSYLNKLQHQWTTEEASAAAAAQQLAVTSVAIGAVGILGGMGGAGLGTLMPASLTPAIAHELYLALERLEAPPELLSIVGSFGDTLSDDEVLRLLKDWNAGGKVIHDRQ